MAECRSGIERRLTFVRVAAIGVAALAVACGASLVGVVMNWSRVGVSET